MTVTNCSAKRLLKQEANALLVRLENVKPFSMHMPMVMAAAISPAAITAIEYTMQTNGHRLKHIISGFLKWLDSPAGIRSSPTCAQQRLTRLRLRFGAILAQFDIFAEAVTQRSEHDYGVWLSGLDVLAEDALNISWLPYEHPPLVCYLDRGLGAAIRRVRTRLPGGVSNPVAIIRVPRERMIGSAVGSSLVHEVGHQAAALLNLAPDLERAFERMTGKDRCNSDEWSTYQRWSSEILADFWSVGKVCITGSLGILSVVSLPRAFVYRVMARESHPTPWLRVRLSCSMGNVLYPHPQWDHLSQLWKELYPLKGLKPGQASQLVRLDRMIPRVAELVANCRPSTLNGRRLRDIMPITQRSPGQLQGRLSAWKKQPALMNSDSPTLVLAVLGQARFDDKLGSGSESRLLNATLKHWAFKRAIETGEQCARCIIPGYHKQEKTQIIVEQGGVSWQKETPRRLQ